jgi:hypothetical protein
MMALSIDIAVVRKILNFYAGFLLWFFRLINNWAQVREYRDIFSDRCFYLSYNFFFFKTLKRYASAEKNS